MTADDWSAGASAGHPAGNLLPVVFFVPPPFAGVVLVEVACVSGFSAAGAVELPRFIKAHATSKTTAMTAMMYQICFESDMKDILLFAIPVLYILVSNSPDSTTGKGARSPFTSRGVHYNGERRMKKVILFFIVVLIAIVGHFSGTRTGADSPDSSQAAEAAAIIPEATTTPAFAENTYPVIRVVDGDTLAVLMDGEQVTLRLIGLDTPETVDPRKPVQCFGKAATDMAKELLTGKTVRLEFDASQGTVDKYGRTLAYIFLADGTLFNEYMIALGYAHEYTYNLPYKYQTEFRAAESRAREEKKGLWADDTCAGDTKKPATP